MISPTSRRASPASAELTPDRTFYFRGPGHRLNRRAQYLLLFLQVMDGIEDDTWPFHLRRGNYSRWFQDHISRRHSHEIIEARYTLPA